MNATIDPPLEAPDASRQPATSGEAGCPSHPVRDPRRAVIIGASIAGLLAARILSERFDEIVLLERDALAEYGEPRKGTPHAIHPHGLLARGRQILEDLFPGLTAALVDAGAMSGDIGTEVAVDADRRRFAGAPIGVRGLAASRLAIEAEVRRRVRALPGVRILDGVDVLAPAHRDRRVCGVRWRARDASDAGCLDAALVLDCSGRGSRSPAWLREWGYDAPPETRVDIGLAYTSAYFRRPPGTPALTGVIGTATPALPRPSILLAQEPDAEGRPRWIAGVGGYAGDHIEMSRDAIAKRAREIGSREIADLAENGEMIGTPIRYAMPYSLRRHYEKLRRFPDGYLVMGDALASFNPIYGQGMTVAACEALALREALAASGGTLATRFFGRAARAIDTPWQLAVGGDLALPCVPGPRPLGVRLINAYVARVRRAARDDPRVAGAFVKVVHMLEAPPSLLAPTIAWRVLVAAIGSRSRRRPGEGDTRAVAERPG